MLLDAKGYGYAKFVSGGRFFRWFKGTESLVSQARRQVAVSGGAPIQWHFAEEAAANATRTLLKENNITGIQVMYTPR